MMEDPEWKYSVTGGLSESITLTEQSNGDLWMWSRPKVNTTYIIGADCASGTGKDFSTFEILDLVHGEQVAEYRGKVDVLTFAKLLMQMGQMYNFAYVVPEVNNMGYGVVQKLVYELGYENVFQTKNEITMKLKKRTYGWVTTPKSRPLLITALATYFNSKDFKWKSRRLWKELSAFVWSEDGKAEAEVGNNDDLVLAMAIAIHNRGTAMMTVPLELNIDIAMPADIAQVLGYQDEYGDFIEKKKKPEDKVDNKRKIPTPAELYRIGNEDAEMEDVNIEKWLRA
jgi:hypothetical protein